MAMGCCVCAVRCIAALLIRFLKNIDQEILEVWGQIRNAPEKPEIEIDTAELNIEQSVELVMQLLTERNILS